MADRVVRVTLSAKVDDYKRGMLEAAQATRTVGTEAQKLQQTRESMQMLGAAGIAMGAALAAGIGVAVSRFAEFDQAMSFVAATGEDARGSLEALREAAIDAGSRTVFSATEAANAIEEMAKAGVSAADILGGGLDGALDLAAAGGLGVADAAGIAATALEVFNLKGTQMSHVADLLAAGAGKAMGDVSDLSAALAQGGQVAAATGLSIEETTATLAAFASQGLLGSDAGTSFKTMLQRLTPQSAEAAAKMDELGISAYDASGNFIGMAEFAGNLQMALRDLTPEQRNSALATMFGADAVRAANVVYQQGESGIRDWISAVDDQGYAAETAATRLDNLIGDWEAFTGALDAAFISMGEGADGPLRFLVQGLTNLVDGFNDLPDWAKQGALGVGLLAAGIGLVGGAFLIAIPKIAAFKVAMLEFSGVGAAARSGLSRFASFLGGPWGIALFAATTAIALFNKQIEQGVPTQAEISNAIKTTSGAVDALNVAASRGSLETFFSGDYSEDLKDLPNLLNHAIDAQNDWTDALSTTVGQKGAYDSLKRLGEALATLASTDLPAATAQFGELAEGLSDVQVEQLLREMPALRDELLKQAEALGISADSAAFLDLAMGELPDGFGQTEQAAIAAKDALDGLVQALSDIAGEAMTMAEAQDNALSAINALRDAAEAEGVALDGTNDASIQFRDSIREVEQAHRDSAQAILENGGTLEAAQGAWAAGRQAVIDMLVAKGMDIDQAAAWADANLGSAHQVADALGQVKGAVESIPEKRHINITVDTSEATRGLNQWIQDSSGRTIRVRVATDGGSIEMGSYTVSPGMALGGPVYGRGPKGKDSELRMLAPGEHVMTASEVDAAGGHREIEGWRAALRAGGSLTRSEPVYVQSGQRSMSADQPIQQLSLDGLSITGTLDIGGDGLARIVDGRISAHDDSANAWSRGGARF